MGSYRGLITGAQQMGENEIVNLLNENVQQEEQTARISEQSSRIAAEGHVSIYRYTTE
jgi:ferritin-like metal-binding protein YciE